MQNHTNNPFKRNVPFWAFDIQSVYFPGPQTAHHFVMKFEHAHQFYEMNISYSHIPVRHTVSGKYTDTTTPFFSFRAPLVLHSVRTLTDAPYTRSIVYFHPRILKKYENVCSLGRLSHVRACTIPLDEKQLERLDRLIIPMSKFWAKDAPENICVSLLAALLYEICDVIPRDLPTEADARPYMQEMMLYIVEHIDEPMTADTLARQFFISKTKLAKDFQTVTGQSVHEYVTAIRLWRAKSMIMEDIPLSVVADACGFSRDSALITMFRREVGMTPGEWRKTVQ